MIALRCAREQDWALVRAVRLAALQEAPEAFCSTYEREAGRSEHQWRMWTQEKPCVVAMDDASAVGMVAMAPTGAPKTCSLLALWVDPGYRKQQVGRTLVEAVLAAARQRGMCRVVLGVIDTNAAARRLYARCGFVVTGNVHHLPGQIARVEVEVEMAVDLRPGAVEYPVA